MTTGYKPNLRKYTVLVCFNAEQPKSWKKGSMKNLVLMFKTVSLLANYTKEVQIK